MVPVYTIYCTTRIDGARKYAKTPQARRFVKQLVANWKGRKHSVATKHSMSVCKRGAANFMYGRCWITNGVINTCILPNDVGKWTALGWYRGRVL